MGYALGLDSGFHIPIVPKVEVFREFFAAIRAAPLPAATASSERAVALKCAEICDERASRHNFDMGLAGAYDQQQKSGCEECATAIRAYAASLSETPASDTAKRYERHPTVGKCQCGLHEVPAGVDGVNWYWQRHSREGCTLELPNTRCWCGRLRSEHIDGHNPETPRPDGDGIPDPPAGRHSKQRRHR